MVGGWSDKTKLILISTLVEVVVEVEVELGNKGLAMARFLGRVLRNKIPNSLSCIPCPVFPIT